MLRQRIVFHGWVQGVGFRYWARHAADMHGATGWVRNDPDDTVTMEIQGTPEQIEQVIRAIRAGRFVRIEDMESREMPPEEEERGFRAE